jgi:hypothetical protein
MELRAAVRFQLRAPVIITWTDASGAKREDLGRTRNISTSGAFLSCHALLPVGTKVGLEIHLPPLERDTLQRVRLKSTGKVIRVTEMAQDAGFAVSGSFTLHDDLLGGVGPQQT